MMLWVTYKYSINQRMNQCVRTSVFCTMNAKQLFALYYESLNKLYRNP